MIIKRHMLKKLGVTTLSVTMLAGGILPSVAGAQESQNVNEPNANETEMETSPNFEDLESVDFNSVDTDYSFIDIETGEEYVINPFARAVLGPSSGGSNYTYLGSFDSTSKYYDTVSQLAARFSASSVPGAVAYGIKGGIPGVVVTAAASAIFGTFYKAPTLKYYRTYEQIGKDSNYWYLRITTNTFSDSKRTKKTGTHVAIKSWKK